MSNLPTLSRLATLGWFAAILLLPCHQTVAEVIALDGFADGGRTNGADPLDMAWYKSASSMQLSVANDSVIGSGNALIIDASFGSSPLNAVVGIFPRVNLGPQIGDSITLSFDFRLNGSVSTDDRDNLRFGLFNSVSPPIAGDTFPEGGNHVGYRAGVRTGTTSGFGAFNRDWGIDLGGSSGTWLATTETGTAPSLANSTTKHSGTIMVERISPTSIEISMEFDGTFRATATDSDISRIESFDEFVIRTGFNFPVDLTLDNITVSTVSVPEPPTIALSLIGVCGLGLICWRRRKRSPRSTGTYDRRNVTTRLLPLLVGSLAICLGGSTHADIISYWNFDSKNDATVNDWVPGSTHDGTLFGSADITSGNQGYGGSGEALSPNAAGTANGRFLAGDPTSYNFSDSFTWYVRSKGSANGTLISRNPAGANWNQGSKSLFIENNTLEFDTGWVGNPETGQSMVDNAWHQVIVTYEAPTDHFSIFIDGIERNLSGTGVAGTHPNQTHDVNRYSESATHNGAQAETALKIGQTSTTGFGNFDGLIDDVALFDEALTGQDLNALIAIGPTAFIPEPGSLALAAIGGAGLCGLVGRRRRRRSG